MKNERGNEEKDKAGSISVPRYQGTGNWTDVPIYPTSGQKHIYPLLSASHLRPSVVKTAVVEVLLANVLKSWR